MLMLPPSLEAPMQVTHDGNYYKAGQPVIGTYWHVTT